MNKKKLIIGIIAIVAGIAFASLGFLPKNADRQDQVNAWNRLSAGDGVETQATVTSVESRAVTEGSRRNRQINTVYCGVYTFQTNSLEYEARAVGDDCKDEREQVVMGDQATVVYDQAQPGIAFVKSDNTKAYYADANGGVWAGIAIGGFLVLLGALAIAGARRKNT